MSTADAFNGGDTGPNEKAAITARNTAMQAYVDEQKSIADARDAAYVQHTDDLAAAEQDAKAADEGLLTGGAIGEAPMIPDTNPPTIP